MSPQDGTIQAVKEASLCSSQEEKKKKFSNLVDSGAIESHTGLYHPYPDVPLPDKVHCAWDRLGNEAQIMGV